MFNKLSLFSSSLGKEVISGPLHFEDDLAARSGLEKKMENWKSAGWGSKGGEESYKCGWKQ